MINSLIVENEKASAEFLLQCLQEQCHDVNVLKVVTGVNEALLFLKDHPIDLLFLDVELNHESGFDLLGHFAKIDFEIIFTTAFDKYAIQAIKNSCLEYLLKPIDPKELKVAVQKFEGKKRNQYNQQLENLINNLKTKPDHAKIAIPTTHGLLFIPITELVVCEADSNYTIIHTLSGERHTSSRNLGEFEQMLPENFFRCHKSFLINLNMIKEFRRTDGNIVRMSNDVYVDVALRRKDDLLKRLK